jgi:hypothetical protein
VALKNMCSHTKHLWTYARGMRWSMEESLREVYNVESETETRAGHGDAAGSVCLPFSQVPEFKAQRTRVCLITIETQIRYTNYFQ